MSTKNKQVVMVIDDSLLICKEIKKALGDEVFISEAHNGEEAMERIAQYQPDLILLDVVLPDTDGYELFGRLKEVDQNNATIIFLTSKDKDEDVIKGFGVGAYDYIKKPFVHAELQSRVNIHLQLKQQKDELNAQNQELRTSMEKLNYMAFRDGLTGLYNRRYVIGDLSDDIKDHSAEEKKNVLILADIDDFKKVNDTYGHEAGDMTLVCIANIFEAICRKYKVIRWGGEEFLIVLFDVTADEAYRLSEQIRTDVEHFKIVHEDQEFFCTVTLGLQVYQEEEGIEENINCADKALYYGKRNGKNRSVWYDSIKEVAEM